MSYTTEGENYRKYGIVIIEKYDEILGYTVYEYRKPIIKERQKNNKNLKSYKNDRIPIKVLCLL